MVRMAVTEKERDLLEAIRNFRASKGRMSLQDQFEDYIKRTVAELMEGGITPAIGVTINQP